VTRRDHVSNAKNRRNLRLETMTVAVLAWLPLLIWTIAQRGSGVIQLHSARILHFTEEIP